MNIGFLMGSGHPEDSSREVVDVHFMHEGNQTTNARYPQAVWAGVCLDSGAERTMMAWAQSREYISDARLPWKLRASPVMFRFGDNLVTSTGIMEIRIPVPGHGFMIVNCHVVRSDVPILLGLDAVRALGLVMDFGRNIIRSINRSWTLPFVYISVHALWSPDCLFESQGRNIRLLGGQT